MEQPSAFPRWADDPPAGPPSTITEPSEPEKDEGFQPGVQAQVVDVTFAGNADGTYNTTINGVLSTFVASGDTLGDIIDGLVADIIADGEPVTPTNVGPDTTLRLTADVAGVAFTYGVSTAGGASAMTATQTTANRSNKPTRQFLNWLFSLIYVWLVWLHQSVFVTDDIFGDQALPGGEADPVPPGLGPFAADHFRANVYVDGYRIGPDPVPGPVYTYAANSDTYWDLSVDAEWTASAVAAMAGAPAVAANSVRCFRHRTDATDVIEIVEYLRDRVTIRNNVALSGNLLLTTETIAADPNSTEISPTGELLAPKLTHHLDSNSGAVYQCLDAVTDNGGLGDVHRYARMTGVGTSAGITLVWGARLTGATTWTVDEADVYRIDINPSGAGINFYSKTGLTPASTFADGTWDDVELANTTRKQLPINFGLKMLGNQLGAGFDVNIAPCLEWVRNIDGAARTELTGDHTASSESIIEYISEEGGVVVYERAINATWNDDAQQWERTLAGQPSWLLQLGTQSLTGFSIRYYPSGDATQWDTADWVSRIDVQNAGTVVYDALLVDGDVTVNNDLDVAGDATTAGAASASRLALTEIDNTPAAKTQYEQGVCKARGFIDSTLGAFVDGTEVGFGYVASYNGGNLRLTFTNAFTGPIDVICQPSVDDPTNGIWFFIPIQVSATVVDLACYTRGGTGQDPSSGAITTRLHFVAFGQHA